MNAYELADYVADNGYIGTGTTHEVANMLRQQADRIAELEKAITNYRTACDMHEEVIKKLEKDNKELHAIAQRMAMAESDARKSLQSYKDAEVSEPVAWRTHYPSGWEYKDGNPPFELKGNSQLLYTHPVKELTDEEIIEVWNVLEDTHSAEHDAKVFARAIEAKVRGQ